MTERSGRTRSADQEVCYSDLIRGDFDGAVDDLDSMHAFSSANAERWAARDGWQPSPTATSDILQSGYLERIAYSEVPAVQARLRADAAH